MPGGPPGYDADKPSALYTTLFQELTPILGTGVSRALLNLQCQKLGITPGGLGKEHLQPLSRQLELALVVFLGAAKTREMVQALSVAGEGGSAP